MNGADLIGKTTVIDEQGGFDYFKKGQKAGGKYDNSLGALAFQAIKAAKATGLTFGKYGDLTHARNKSINHLSAAAKLGYPYSMGKGGGWQNMGLKGAGTFCFYLFGETRKNRPELDGLMKELSDKAHKSPERRLLLLWGMLIMVKLHC